MPLDRDTGSLASGSETTAETIPLSGFPLLENTVNANGIEVITFVASLEITFVMCVNGESAALDVAPTPNLPLPSKQDKPFSCLYTPITLAIASEPENTTTFRTCKGC